MAAVVIVLDLSIIGCDLVSDTVPLQTVPNGPFAGNCRGVGLDGILVGSLADPRHAWVVDVGHDTRMDVQWPFGYRARFSSGLEIRDRTGQVVARGGDTIGSAWLTGGGLELMPPFK
jgi:hypothetical protein